MASQLAQNQARLSGAIERAEKYGMRAAERAGGEVKEVLESISNAKMALVNQARLEAQVLLAAVEARAAWDSWTATIYHASGGQISFQLNQEEPGLLWWSISYVTAMNDDNDEVDKRKEEEEEESQPSSSHFTWTTLSDLQSTILSPFKELRPLWEPLTPIPVERFLSNPSSPPHVKWGIVATTNTSDDAPLPIGVLLYSLPPPPPVPVSSAQSILDSSIEKLESAHRVLTSDVPAGLSGDLRATVTRTLVSPSPSLVSSLEQRRDSVLSAAAAAKGEGKR